MSQVKVIITPTTVYTTICKTIHLEKDFKSDEEKKKAQSLACEIAFNLACTSPRSYCEKLELTLKNRDEVFSFLEKCHAK